MKNLKMNMKHILGIYTKKLLETDFEFYNFIR